MSYHDVAVPVCGGGDVYGVPPVRERLMQSGKCCTAIVGACIETMFTTAMDVSSSCVCYISAADTSCSCKYVHRHERHE